MSSCDCKTIQVLRQHVENNTENARLASICLNIIEDIRESGLSDLSTRYLREFLDNVYAASGLHLFDHLQEGADCDICKAIASRL